MNVPTTKGKLILSYNPATSIFTCSLNEKLITKQVSLPTGEYVLTLRSGIHSIIMATEHGIGKEQTGMLEHDEGSATGNFIAKFDNLNLIEK